MDVVGERGDGVGVDGEEGWRGKGCVGTWVGWMERRAWGCGGVMVGWMGRRWRRGGERGDGGREGEESEGRGRRREDVAGEWGKMGGV